MVFRPPAGLLPPEAEIVEFFASFWDDFAVKSVDFSMQNAKSKYQIPKIFACSSPECFFLVSPTPAVLKCIVVRIHIFCQNPSKMFDLLLVEGGVVTHWLKAGMLLVEGGIVIR